MLNDVLITKFTKGTMWLVEMMLVFSLEQNIQLSRDRTKMVANWPQILDFLFSSYKSCKISSNISCSAEVIEYEGPENMKYEKGKCSRGLLIKMLPQKQKLPVMYFKLNRLCHLQSFKGSLDK